MKNSKLNIFVASMILSGVLLSGHALADKNEVDNEKPNRQMIKVKAKQGSDIKVMVGNNGEKNQYTFSAQELENMDNVAAKLSDLDEATSTKVLQLLTQLSAHDAKVVELKNMDIKYGESESKIVMVKTGNDEGEMHIEIDVEGDGEFHEKRLHKSFFAEGKGGHKAMYKHMKRDWEQGEKPDFVKVIKRLIKKSELTDEQVTEIKTLLDNKNS